MNAPHLTRRDFTAGLGGIVLAFSLAPLALTQQPPRLPGSLQTNRMLSAWLAINADGTATVFTGKVELGQGILTALAQIAAEELDLPLARVRIISGDTGRTPNEGQTAGSQSVENSGTALRLAGAEVRAILLDLAAKKFGVAADTLKVADGTITTSDGRKVSYGELAKDADLKREATGKVAPKPAAQHRLVGQSLPRVDLPAKVTGGAAFVQDLRLPGMVHGRIARPPQYGAQLEAFDEAKVRAMPGVVAVVRDGSFLGVAAEREEQAIKAVEALSASAKWKAGPALPDPARLYEQLKTMPTQDTVISNKEAPLLASGAKVVEATYHRPYQAHASLGAILRGRAGAGRSVDRLDAQPGRLPAARHDGAGARHEAAVDPLHPHGRRGLLRPQRRRRRRARRGAAGARHQWTSGPRAMDAGRGVHVGALRPRHDHAGQGRRGRRPDRGLELRRLEPEPQHAAGRSRRHQPAVELVPGRPEAAGPGAAGDRAELRRRSQCDPDLRSAAADASPIT